ncbi:MAG: 50S ribosomal protein L29 [Acidobacteriota bacterium]
MKSSKLRELSVEELEEESYDLSKQLFQLRFKQATGQLEDMKKIGAVRKDLARVKTILTEKGAPRG